MSTPPTPTNPARIFNTLTAYQSSAALKAALELSLFTAIAEGHNTVPTLAQRCTAAPRGIRILADHLTLLGFLTKSADTYALPEDSALFLDQNSPAYIGAAAEFLLAPHLLDNFLHLADRTRLGGAPTDDNALAPNHDLWVRFARGMAGLMMMPAQTLAQFTLADAPPRPMNVLDIAAGHGIFGIAFAQQNPLAQITGLDWPNVLEVAKENAQKFGVADRYATLPGSAFNVNMGHNTYDLVLIPNFLHHFDAPTNTLLLKKIHSALKPKGTAVALEFAPNDDRLSPPPSAAFALVMLASTPAGDAYTTTELAQMFTDAGFKSPTATDLPNTMQRAIAAQK